MTDANVSESANAAAIADAKIAKPVTPIDQLLPFDFFDLAKDFMHAYKTCPSMRPPEWPSYFLFCHAIELSLKAFLALHGLSREELASKTYGHNLASLMTKAVELGLQFSKTDTMPNILLLNEAHTEYWPRYPRAKAKPVFVIDNFDADADDLFRSVSTALYRGVP